MFDVHICLTVYMHAHTAMHSEQAICQKMYHFFKNRCGKVNVANFCLLDVFPIDA